MVTPVGARMVSKEIYYNDYCSTRRASSRSLSYSRMYSVNSYKMTRMSESHRWGVSTQRHISLPTSYNYYKRELSISVVCLVLYTRAPPKITIAEISDGSVQAIPLYVSWAPVVIQHS